MPEPSGSDDSTSLQALIDLAAANGGVVHLGVGTYLASGLLIKSNVTIQGKGPGATVLKLAGSADEDLITVADFATLAAGTTQAGPSKWMLRDLTLDGNDANNTSGWPLRVYASRYTIDNVEVTKGASGGVWSQWGTSGTDMEAHWSNFRIHDCAGDGLSWHGPHDSVFVNGHIFKNVGKGVLTASPATSEQFTNIHVWGDEHTDGCHFSSPVYAVNCQVEGAADASLVLNCNFGQWIGGAVFGTGTGSEVAIQVGDTATARYWDIDTRVYNLGASGVAVAYVDTNKNRIRLNLDSSTGLTAVYSGTPAAMDHLDVWCGDDPQVAADYSDRVVMGNTRFFSADGTRGAVLAVYNDRNYLLLDESAASPIAASNAAVIFAEDDGGKTGLYVRFGSGDPIELAIEA